MEWVLKDNIIDINYRANISTLVKELAVSKLEYILRPLYNKLRGVNNTLAKETLAYRLFTYALLTRNYIYRLDVFFLNIALSIRLATEMKLIILK